jgi:UDP-glucose 4-epimerase
MKVLITGGSGFVGSHLAELLLSKGNSVVALDSLSTGSVRNIEHLQGDDRFQFVKGNILDVGTLEPLIKDADVVYHLAAAVGVKYILEHPVETLTTNVKGTENVLQLAHQHGNKKTILASTSEVYGKGSRFPFSEDDDSVLGPTTTSRWGYACSKAMDEFLGLAYHREMGLPVVIFRLFNTVGPRQTGHYGMVLPTFVQQAIAGDPITVYGDGEQLRCFTYVHDVVQAMVDILEVESVVGEVFNVGSNREISINDLASLVKETLTSDSRIDHIPYERVYSPGFEDMRRRLPDYSKLQSYINYHPNTDLAGIIREISDTLMEQPD